MKKRIFSILTALALCLTLLPAAAWAAEPTYDLWQITDGEDTGLYYGTYDPEDEINGTKVRRNEHSGNNYGQYILSDGSYRLAEDITIDHSICISNGTLDLNGYVLKGEGEGNVINMTTGDVTTDDVRGGDLTLKDSRPKIKHYFTVEDSGLWTLSDEEHGTKVVEGGVITTTTATNRAARGVTVNGSFTMTGGNIVGCMAGRGGGAGSGVDVSGTFKMTGGSIVGCMAPLGGGGVYVRRGSFTMSGGEIKDCKARDGGGVCVYSSSFTMSGGEIKDCVAERWGNGVFVYNGGTFKMTGGTIFDSEGEAKSDTVLCLDPDPQSTAPLHATALEASGGVVYGDVCNDSHRGCNSVITNTSDDDDATVFYGALTNRGEIGNGNYLVTFFEDTDTSYAWEVVQENGKAVEPDALTKKGYTLAGWYNSDTEWDFDDPVTGALNLTAGWTHDRHTLVDGKCECGAVQYTVLCYRMDPEGNYPAENEPTETIIRADTVGSIVYVPNHSDNGFYVDTEKSDASGTVTEDGSLVLKLYQARKQYTVTYDANGGSAVAPQTYYYGQSMTAPAEPTREGYEFLGWCEESKFTYPDIESMEMFDFGEGSMPGKALKLKAVWQRKLSECTITVEPLPYTGKEQKPDITITDADKTLVEGEDYVLLRDGSSVTSATKPGTYDLTIRGTWAYCGMVTVTWSIDAPDYEAPTYSITAPRTDNGTVTVFPKNAARTTTVTVTVTPDAGYELESLSVYNEKGSEIALTDRGNGKYTFKMPAGEVEIEAEFAPIQSVSRPETEISFADVSKKDYFYDAVRWAVEQGITTGISDTQFGPHASCTRGQLVTFLWRAVGCPVVDYAMNFSDVDEGGYCGEAIRWAAASGIVGGYGGGLFGAEDEITRDQVVTILYRFAVAMGADVSVGEDTNILSYNDVFDVPEYAMEAFQWAVGAGIVQGDGGNLMPAAGCTRAQIVTMLYRLLEQA